MRTSNVAVRSANVADTERLAELSGELGYPSTPAQIAARLSALQGREEQAVQVAESEGRVLGWVHVFVYRSIEDDAKAEIGGLVVEESARGFGVGARLLAAAEHWASAQGCREIGLRSNVIREAAHTFYEGRGYRVIKTQKSFRKKL